jgi:hypothetical protein
MTTLLHPRSSFRDRCVLQKVLARIKGARHNDRSDGSDRRSRRAARLRGPADRRNRIFRKGLTTIIQPRPASAAEWLRFVAAGFPA